MQSSTLGSSRKGRVKGRPGKTGLALQENLHPRTAPRPQTHQPALLAPQTRGTECPRALLLFPVSTTQSSMRSGEVAGSQLSLLLAVVPSPNHPTAI